MKPVIKSSFGRIIFLVGILGVVLAIMAYLKTDMGNFGTPGMPEFQESIKVIDKTYFNKPLNFRVSMPNSDWDMVCVDRLDSLRSQDLSLPILDNINVLAEMYRRDGLDTLSLVQVGVIQLAEPRTPQSLASQNFKEVSLSFPAPDTVRVVQPVTFTDYGALRGAYYMVEFPEQLNYAYRVWLSMFIVYNKISYTIICQVRSEDYAFLRSDLEKILQSFRPLNFRDL